MAPGGLGRRTPPDWDHLTRHPMAETLAGVGPATVSARYWDVPIPYDQGNTPECTGYSAAQCMTAVVLAQTGRTVRFDAPRIYQWANANDGIPQPHDGSTVREAFNCLTQIGADELALDGVTDTGPIDKLKSFVWTQDPAQVVQAILTTGPVVLGVNWYAGMSQPDGGWFIHPTGQVEGGHAIIAHAALAADGRVTLKNQWKDWGWQGQDPGDVLLSYEDLGTLLGQDGEACLAIWQ